MGCDDTKFNSVFLNTAVRGEGRAPEIPDTKSARFNQRSRKHNFGEHIALFTELLLISHT